MSEQLEVTQADRDAAALVFDAFGWGRLAAACRAGETSMDGTAVAIVFARHRIAHTPPSQPLPDVVEAIIRDVCELPGDNDIEADNTLLSVDDLRVILERNLASLTGDA